MLADLLKKGNKKFVKIDSHILTREKKNGVLNLWKITYSPNKQRLTFIYDQFNVTYSYTKLTIFKM
jgi:hypothetical protein